MRSCVYCKTRYEKGSGVTFHKFPSDNTLQCWLKNMKLANWTPKTYDYLCSKHFTVGCFIKHQSRTTLKKSSVPTIFLETELSSVDAQSTMSKDEYQCHADVNINLDKLNTQSVPVPVELPISDYQNSEKNIKGILLCETPTTHNTTAVPTTSNNIIQQSVPKRSRTLSEICASVKLDHQYENAPESSKKEFERVKRALKLSQARVKVLSQNVKRLKKGVSNLRSVIADLKKQKSVCVDCLCISNQNDDFKPQLLKRNTKNTKCAKYAPELKLFAITLYFYLPKPDICVINLMLHVASSCATLKV